MTWPEHGRWPHGSEASCPGPLTDLLFRSRAFRSDVKHALVIEGGGMKAAFANGVLTAFEQARHRPFSGVYGTSAGGALAAWFSAGQAGFAEGTWRYARDPRFLSIRRALLGRGPFLDHELLLDQVYVAEHPLDVEAVRRAPWPVVVTAADVDTGECVYQDIRGHDVLSWLKATGRLPFASGPPVEIGGRRFVDGGVLDPIPVRRAIDDGADRVTLILNKPVERRKADSRFVLEMASRRYPALRDGIVQHHAIKAHAIAFALDPPDGVRVDVIRPPSDTGVSRMSRDMDRIRRAVSWGRDAGRRHVDAPFSPGNPASPAIL